MNDRLTSLVSVVIPTYNHARYLGRALQSVLNQTYTNWEAIVIDNHSTDTTDEIMASFNDPRIAYIKIHNNGVIAASRNAGIRAAKGEWIAFLDSDDWWTNDKLEVCFDSVDEKVDLVHHDMEIVSEQPRPFKRKIIKSRQLKTPVLIDLLLKANPIVNSSVVVRKSLLEKIGGINESLEMVAAEDYNTWLRISILSSQFFYLPRRLGFYLTHNQNVSQKNMSVPTRRAVSEFVNLLSPQQKNRLESSLCYTRGRFNCLAGNHLEAKKDLLFVIKYGYLMLKIKSSILIFMAMSKVIFGSSDS
jgi:glycosyltransferase involved in cell wall biosynthesis